ncbi:hypothetical protein H4582DRAFT_2112245 [Lactarius indigo]|nr:hypothetical protein H4582DRAFT_2112245 [Lactarius indigo]
MADVENTLPVSLEVHSASASPIGITKPTTTAKTDAEEDTSISEGEETPEVQALTQVEFYFADANLPYDKFMWTLHTANEEHWVPIATIASFKRMREFQPRGVEWVANVLRTSTVLQVSEDGTKVRRRAEVQKPKDAFDRSVYAKGFGEEVPGLQRNLEQFFSKYGKVAAVRMRRVDGTKAFKGSVFAEFVEYKSVEAFLNADPKPTWDDNELLIMSKEAYVEMKIKEKGLKGKAAIVKRDHITRKGFDAFRLTAEGKDPKSGKKDAGKAKPEIFVEFFGAKLRVLDEEGGSVDPEGVPRVRGSALRFVGCGGEVSFDEIKRPLKERFSRAPFVKFTKGDDAGLVGFDKALVEEDLAFVREKLPTLNGKPITWELPEGKFGLCCLTRGARYPRRARGWSRCPRRAGRNKGGDSDNRPQNDGDEQVGNKRKRTVEPDGGDNAGVRGQAVPTVVSASSSKRPKTDGGES